MKTKDELVMRLFYLREFFFPSGCGSCGKVLLNCVDAFFGLCGECRKLFNFFDDDKRCKICGRPLISEMDICLSCRDRGRKTPEEIETYGEYISKMLVLFPYTGKFRSILSAYKFEKCLGIGNFFTRKIAFALENFGTEISIVPVPPRPGKIKNQGWDQIDYLVKLLAKDEKCFNVSRCLKRLPSKSQKELNRAERSVNLSGRILCVRKPPETAVILDDVITTGATLNACAEALIKAGTSKVYGLCLFYD